MKKIRLMALLLSISSCLMLFSVGFASWNGLTASSASTSGSFVVYPPGSIEANPVQINGEEKPILGEFSPDGFMTSGNSNQGGGDSGGGDSGSGESTNTNGINLSDTGYLTFALTIDEKCLTDSSLTIQFKLQLEYGLTGSGTKQALPCVSYDGLKGTVVILGSTTKEKELTMMTAQDGKSDPLTWSVTFNSSEFSLIKNSTINVTIPFVIDNSSGIEFKANESSKTIIYYKITPMIQTPTT